MRHILIISSSFPESASGEEAAGSFVADFAEALSHKVQVTVLTPGTRNETAKRGKCVIERFSVPSLPLSLLNPINPLHWYFIYKTLHSGSRRIGDIVNKHNFNHILALWALPSGWWAWSGSRKSGVKYSVWALGSDIWAMSRIPVVRGCLAYILRNATNCFADGYALCSDIKRIAGVEACFVPSSRQFNPISTDRGRDHDKMHLAFLGRWHANKGVDLLIDSLRLLGDEDWQRISEVRIYGGGPLQDAVLSGVKELNNAGRPVISGGYLNKEEAKALISWADYLLIPSRIESIPVVFSDAMQAERPVIVTPVGDMPGIMAKFKSGFITDGVSPDEICNTIRQALVTNPSKFEKGIQEAAAAFNPEKAVSMILDKI